MKTEEITIPENIQDICREFATIALKHELHNFSLSFRPSFDQGWGGEVACRWEWGRHGDDSQRLVIQSSFSVHTKASIEVKP